MDTTASERLDKCSTCRFSPNLKRTLDDVPMACWSCSANGYNMYQKRGVKDQRAYNIAINFEIVDPEDLHKHYMEIVRFIRKWKALGVIKHYEAKLDLTQK